MNAIELSGLEVELGGRRVLGPLDHAFPEGSLSLIVGPSGSGKSTLLRAIAGLAVPRAGIVRLNGVVASEGSRLQLAPEKRRVGFLFQGGGGLWPHLSVERTLRFVLACRKVPREARPRRVQELVALVELQGLEKRRPGELSGGEAQRLGLARALALDPKLLLLDEPLGPLDARLRGALLGRLGALHAELGLTTLFVTHDPEEARALADQVLRLESGKLVV